MSDRRQKNVAWYVADATGKTYDGIWGSPAAYPSLAVLMDIRDELQTLNRLLSCPNFIAIPTILRTIRRNTSDLRKQKKPARKKSTNRSCRRPAGWNTTRWRSGNAPPRC